MAERNFPERFERRLTRPVKVGNVDIGRDAPTSVQSMTATDTQDVDATVSQVLDLKRAGVSIVRIAVDSRKVIPATFEIRARTVGVALSVDLQESYSLVTDVAPIFDEIRYNPGHLHHHEKGKTVAEKVEFIARTAQAYGRALRVGVNCGSVDPRLAEKYGKDSVDAVVHSALEHCQILDKIGFYNYTVSLKDSDPNKVVEANTRFASLRPDVPLHLGVTEAGMPPEGVIKSRNALGRLLTLGIGETLRVSLTVDNERKSEEVIEGLKIIEDAKAGLFRFVESWTKRAGINIISCPSCSRVQNTSFVQLAQRISELTSGIDDINADVSVMGCRVNGPGEADEADIGVWSGKNHVNLKRGERLVGAFGEDEILDRFMEELGLLRAEKKQPA